MTNPMKPKDDLGELVKEWREQGNFLKPDPGWATYLYLADQLKKALEGKVVVDRGGLKNLLESIVKEELGTARGIIQVWLGAYDKYLPKEDKREPAKCKNPDCIEGFVAHRGVGGEVYHIECPDCQKEKA